MKKNNIWFDAIFAIAFLGFGIALIFASVKFFKDYNHDKKDCTQKVKAQVIDYEYSPPIDDEDEGSYHPVVEYKIDGKTYRKTLINYSKEPKEGTYITIYCNPKNPEEIFFKENTGLYMAPIGSTIFTLVGGVFTVKIFIDIKRNKNSGYEIYN